MQSHTTVFVDAGFLNRTVAAAMKPALGRRISVKEIRIDYLELVQSFRLIASKTTPFLRAYWYDGALDPVDSGYARQRSHFEEIAETPGIQLRLGHMTPREESW